MNSLRFLAHAGGREETAAEIQNESRNKNDHDLGWISQAFEMAGVLAADVDLAEIYDCFTAVVLVTLEDYGFCKKGEGGSFVENGRIQLGGRLPVNTHGGLLSHAHIGGISHLTEAVTQLRHQAGARQVPDAKIALANGQCGELGIHVTLLFSNSTV